MNDLLREARERYQAGIDADRSNRKRDQEDRTFYTGGDNQWDAAALKERRDEGRPAETYNRLPQFVKQVTGEIRQNKPAIKVLPVDGQSDPEIAKVYSAIIRHIENNKDGHRVYSKETEKAVIGGQGWWRVKADYYDDASFEQELCIEGIPNPNAVVADPDARELTRADMSWCFVTELISKKKFEKQYPDVPLNDWDATDTSLKGWLEGDFVRVAEYWVKKEVGKQKLYAFRLPQGQTETATEKEANQFLADAGLEYGSIEDAAADLGIEILAVRQVPVHEVCSYLMCGTAVLQDKQVWPGKYIPLVRVPGEEVEAGDTVFRHGLIHHAKPAQKGYNYARNAMLERHMLATKAPWLIALKQIPAAFKHMWETANKKNWPFLPYDPQPNAPLPVRTDPPQLDAAAYQESLVSSDDMKATTGIYDAQLGAKSNETSGVAIAKRDAQGDTATYVYIDNMEAAISTTGRILIDLIPHYYSDERVIRIIGEDGEIERFEAINKLMPDGGTWNDVSRGKFDVVVSTGPAYATRRMEAADKLVQLIQAYPPVAGVAGDIVAKVIDVPFADKIAERLQMTLPPGLDEEVDRKREEKQGPPQPPPPSPEEQKLAAETQMKMLDLESKQREGMMKLELQRAEAEQDMALQREKFEFEKSLAMEKFEFEKALAMQKARLDADIAEHDAELKQSAADHSAALAERKVSQNKPGGSVAE